MKVTILLRVVLHGRMLKAYAFDQDVIRIGRDSQCDICLPNRSVSRVHVQLKRRESGFLLEDSGSSNGTFVNGESVKAREIESGDTVTIGSFVLEAELTSGPQVPLVNRSIPPEVANAPTLRNPKA